MERIIGWARYLPSPSRHVEGEASSETVEIFALLRGDFLRAECRRDYIVTCNVPALPRRPAVDTGRR